MYILSWPLRAYQQFFLPKDYTSPDKQINTVVFIGLLIMFIGQKKVHTVHSAKTPPLKCAKNEKTEKFLISILSAAFLFLPLGWYVGSFDDFTIGINIPIRVLLLIPHFLGIFIHLKTHYLMQEWWNPTLQIRENQPLLTLGTFSWVRHPMYLAAILYWWTIGLIIDNAIVFSVMFSAITLLVVGRIPNEEAMMKEEFGNAYNVYSQTTPMIIPFSGFLKGGKVPKSNKVD